MSSLYQFIAGYFHQDWPEEAQSPEEIITNYAASEPREVVEESLNELKQLIAEVKSEAQLKHILLVDLGSYYDPTFHNQTISAWLQSVAN